MSPFALIILFFSVSLNKAQTVQLSPATDWHKSVDNSVLVCSVSDFYYNNNSNLYWIEYNANRAYKYGDTSVDNIISDIYANVYDNTLLKPLHNFTVTNNKYDQKFQNTTSLPQSCRNPQTNDIITSYSIGYIRNNKYGNGTLSTHLSIYWRIFEMNQMEFTQQVLAFDGLIQPYNNINTSFNYNFNSRIICNDNYYLLSWYHWDQYQTYLDYRIIYKDSSNNYIQGPIIHATDTTLYNVSLLISAFGRTKTIQSKSDKTKFMGLYNHFDSYILLTKWWNSPVEYASTCNAIIGQVVNKNGNYDINWITTTPFVINQITHAAETVGFETGTLQSDYVLVENNPHNNSPGCCFVVLYGESWQLEVWGICRLYLTVINDVGNHVIKSDVQIWNFANALDICDVYDPLNEPFDGLFGNAQVIELDMLRTNTESYFMIAFTSNYISHSEVRGIIYKLYYDSGKNEYFVDKIKSNLENKNEFISYTHRRVENGRITFDVCFHINNNSKQLFVGYTLNNVTDNLLRNNQTLKQPLFTRIYDVSM